MSEKEKVSYKTKLHEPILNPIQVSCLMLIVLFEVVSNLIPILMGLDINPIYVIVMVAIGVVSYSVVSMLRAAYPEAVPDTRIITAFRMFIKQVIDALVANPDDKSDLQTLLERLMVWCVREWDVIYQEELAEAIEYAKAKLNGKPVVEYVNTTAGTRTKEELLAEIAELETS